MRKAVQLLLLASLVLAAVALPDPGAKGGRRGRKRKNKKPGGRRKGGGGRGGGGGGGPAAIKTCYLLDNCYYPIHETCLRPFDVAGKGRTVLYGQGQNGILKSGTKSKESLGSLILYSNHEEVLQLEVEIELASWKGGSAKLHVNIYQSMCGDWEEESSTCDPGAQHEEYFPFIRNCEAVLEPETHYLDYQTMRFETTGVFLKIYINDSLVGRVALPHEGCDTRAPRVKINHIALTGAGRGMARPRSCN